MNCMCVVCCNSKRSGLFVCAVDCKARFVGDTVPADGQVNLEVCFRCELHTLCTSPPTLPSPRTFLFYTCTHGVDFFCFTLVHMKLIFLFYACTHGVDFFVLHLYTWSCRTWAAHVFMCKILSGETILYILHNWQQTETDSKQGLAAEEDGKAWQKTWQVYCFGKRNVHVLV